MYIYIYIFEPVAAESRLASRNSEDFVSQCSDFSLDSLETSALVVETVWAVQESGMCQIS